MNARKQVPIKSEKSSDGDTVETHPSFGMVSVSRYTCNPPQHFFGSAIAHHAGVSLSISIASRRRNLSNNWYFEEGELVEINMTEAQFAELMCSFNTSGVPCTMNHVNSSVANLYPEMGVPPCPERNERKQIEAEFKREMSNVTKGLQDLIEKARVLQEKPSINKTDRKEFLDIAETLQRKIDSCLPFIQGQFNEAMDGVLVHAKADLESFTGQILRQAGVEAVQDRVKAMSSTVISQIEDSKPVV